MKKDLGIFSSLDHNMLKEYLSKRSQKMSPVSHLYFGNRSQTDLLKPDRNKTDKSEHHNEYVIDIPYRLEFHEANQALKRAKETALTTH